ncbi:MAG: calcium/sodium antiporter [Smithellaceae bacterium]
MAIFLFIVGLVLLIVGAEALVRGASRLAALLGVSPLVIGLTVVALGTSSPELAVSVKSVLSSQSDIAVGNIIGSNIINVLLILGLSALIAPLIVSKQLIRLDVPIMIAFSVIVLIFALDGVFSRLEGVVLLSGLIAYILFSFFQSRRAGAEAQVADVGDSETQRHTKKDWVKNTVMVLFGLVLLVQGSHWLVEGAVSFARYIGVSELIIGLTIVAGGTSLPEVVTSVVAAIRGERDIAVGNVVGSNIFNIMGVLGLAVIVAPGGIQVSSAVIGFDIPVMIAVAFACLPLFFTGGEISRPEGALLLGYYVAYTMYLILAAAHHDALPVFGAVMLYFVLPLTAVTLVIVALREIRARRMRRSG